MPKAKINLERLYEDYTTTWDFEEKSLMIAAVHKVMKDYKVSSTCARNYIDKMVFEYNLPRPSAGYMNWEYANDAVRGTPKTDEHKAKIAAGNKGKVYSEETREKMRKSHIGKYRGKPINNT